MMHRFDRLRTVTSWSVKKCYSLLKSENLPRSCALMEGRKKHKLGVVTQMGFFQFSMLLDIVTSWSCLEISFLQIVRFHRPEKFNVDWIMIMLESLDDNEFTGRISRWRSSLRKKCPGCLDLRLFAILLVIVIDVFYICHNFLGKKDTNR